MQAATFFTDQQKKHIAEAIRRVETKTAGEVAVMVVDRSDTYPEAAILAGLLGGGLSSLLLTDLFFADSLWAFLPLSALLGLACGWASRLVPDLQRLLLSNARLERQVQQRAVRSFYEKELYRTRDQTGVLFFLSLFEHKVWVLADRGIYEKISQGILQGYADGISRGVKNGRAADALCDQIEQVGTLLAKHFPIKPDDTNELSNEVIIGS